MLAIGGCSNSTAPSTDGTPLLVPTPPSVPAKPVIKKEAKSSSILKVVKTPEGECDEVIVKLKEVEFWSPSGMSENGKQSLIQDIYVGDNGVLQMGMCDWFWELST